MMTGNCRPARQRPQLVASLLLLFGALCCGPSALAFIEPDNLASRAIALKDDFQSVSDADITQSAAQLKQKLTRLEEFLSKGGLEGWKQYLDSELLQTQLADSGEADAEQGSAILAKFTANYFGLKQREFRKVAAALQNYLGLLEVQALPDAAEHHASIMQEMSGGFSSSQRRQRRNFPRGVFELAE